MLSAELSRESKVKVPGPWAGSTTNRFSRWGTFLNGRASATAHTCIRSWACMDNRIEAGSWCHAPEHRTAWPRTRSRICTQLGNKGCATRLFSGVFLRHADGRSGDLRAERKREGVRTRSKRLPLLPSPGLSLAGCSPAGPASVSTRRSACTPSPRYAQRRGEKNM